MTSPADLRQRFLAAVRGNDPTAVAALYHEDAVLIAPEGTYEGRDYVEAYYRLQFRSFPDGRLNVLATYECGDALIGEWTFAGTNTGPLELPSGETLEPTGRAVTQRGADVAVLRGDRIQVHRVYYDQLELLEPLGLHATAQR
jgi:ketosteroid isomerase-like protein